MKGGVVVHDHFKPYSGLVEVIHAFCNAHILRELEGLIEFEKEPWAELMRALLREANAAVRAAREAGKRALPPEKVEAFVERYWAAVRMGLAYHRGLPEVGDEVEDRGRRQTTSRPQSARQAEEVQNRNAAVPHRLRRALHQQPRRTGSEDDEGQDENLRLLPDPRGRADFRAACRSVVSTARKQGFNILQVLTATPERLMQSLAV